MFCGQNADLEDRATELMAPLFVVRVHSFLRIVCPNRQCVFVL